MVLAFKSRQSLLLSAINTILELSQHLSNAEPLTLAKLPRIKLHFWCYRTLKHIGLKHSFYPKSEKNEYRSSLTDSYREHKLDS